MVIMNEGNNSDGFLRLLEIFDKQEMGDIHGRRTAYKPLYEYFQRLVMEVGVSLCNLNRDSLKNYQINGRWNIIKDFLNYIEDANIWDELIRDLYKVRNGVEHNDEYDPPLDTLNNIREKTPEFTSWIIRIGGEYFKSSKNFNFKDLFYRSVKINVMEGERLFSEYGESPYIEKSEYPIYFDDTSYQQLKKLINILNERLEGFKLIDEVDRADLEKLIKLVKIIYTLKGREEILLENSICPKCGDKIEETQEYIGGGTESNPEPTGIFYRVGCQKCDFLIDEETIDI